MLNSRNTNNLKWIIFNTFWDLSKLGSIESMHFDRIGFYLKNLSWKGKKENINLSL